MNNEITKKDLSLTDKEKPKSYGRGSRARLKHIATDLTFTLVDQKGTYWTVLNPHGMMESVHENQIDKIIFDGHWFNFDPHSKGWKKSR